MWLSIALDAQLRQSRLTIEEVIYDIVAKMTHQWTVCIGIRKLPVLASMKVVPHGPLKTLKVK